MPQMIDRRRFVTSGVAAVALARSLAVQGAAGGAGTSLPGLEIGEAAALVRRRQLSPVQLTEACLARIEKLNPQLNAFITVTADAALEQARACERELDQGRSRGPLHGIPVALKDNIDTAGIRTTAAARGLASRVPAADADVMRRLRDAGAVLLGKLNMDECAYGVSTTTGAFGATQNPWKAGYIAGGSSGGPAAAVAARLCFAALGTDTGGSIRQPAAYCGIVGLKPTVGLVSTRGVIPLSWSLDNVGPLCRSASDAALVLQAIAGYDPGDPASRQLPAVDYAAAAALDTLALRLGKPGGNYFATLDPEVEAAINAALAELAALTARTRDVELPPLPMLPLMAVEANAYLGPLVRDNPDGYSPAIQGLVRSAERTSAADYAEAVRGLEQLRRSVQSVFSTVDLLVTPTTPDLPMTIDASLHPGPQHGPPLSARNTTPFNLYGLPTISVPCGFSRSGLPIGLQISGPPGGEGRVLALAAAYQRRTDWHRRAPAA